MKEVVAQVESGGYEAGAQCACRFLPALREYLFSVRRTDWLFHALPVQGAHSCLDIGSGCGTLSRALTNFFPAVYSLEIMRERLSFQSAFKRFERLDGLRLLRGVATELPFPDQSFDLVVANGIIQWVGLSDPARPVPELQRQFLNECRRVLKDGGVLCLGCENRFGMSEWLGQKDHSGLPYTSIMPRVVADWAVPHFRKTQGQFVRSYRSHEEWTEYRTYTYSAGGYEKLLTECGYGEIRGYWAHPDNNFSDFMGRLDDERSMLGLLEFVSRTFDLRVRGGMFSHAAVRLRRLIGLFPSVLRVGLRALVPSFVFVARRGEKSRAHGTIESLVGTYAVRRSGSNKTVWWGGRASNRNLVVKMARFPQERQAVEADEAAFGRENGLKIIRENHAEWTLFREPLLQAWPIDELSDSDHRAALAWLLDFHARNASGRWERNTFDSEIGTWLSRFSKTTADSQILDVAERACESLLDHFPAGTLPVVAEHGDFCRNNILKRKDGTLYILD